MAKHRKVRISRRRFVAGSTALAAHVREAMLDRTAALMSNHGAVAAAATLAKAVANISTPLVCTPPRMLKMVWK